MLPLAHNSVHAYVDAIIGAKSSKEVAQIQALISELPAGRYTPAEQEYISQTIDRRTTQLSISEAPVGQSSIKAAYGKEPSDQPQSSLPPDASPEALEIEKQCNAITADDLGALVGLEIDIFRLADKTEKVILGKMVGQRAGLMTKIASAASLGGTHSDAIDNLTERLAQHTGGNTLAAMVENSVQRTRSTRRT